ncbi:MAG: metallophosphoesterase [Thermoplasmataceae archaeon]
MEDLYLALPGFINETIDRYIKSIGKPVPVKKIGLKKGTISFIGDTHGALDVTAYATARENASDLICFVGDLVDRGKRQLFNLLYIMEMAVISRKIIIVRGNHESTLTNDAYGFIDELRKLGLLEEVYPHILRLYGKLPYALHVATGIVAVHGGIPQSGPDMKQWDTLPMDDLEPSNPTAFEIMWNDPREYIDGFLPGVRGEGTFYFGPDAYERFAERNKIKLFVRAHEVKKAGYEYYFNNHLISIFSSRYHKGKAAILRVNIESPEKKQVVVVPELLPGEEWLPWPQP